MGYILDHCPTTYACCMSVPLRPAVFAIAVLGLAWGSLYFFGYTELGAKLAEDAGMSPGMAKVMRYVHGVFGILLFAVNVLLLAAAVHESDALCEVYMWFMVVFWAVLVLTSLSVALAAVVADKLPFAGIYLLLMSFVAIMALYFIIIVANYRMTLP